MTDDGPGFHSACLDERRQGAAPAADPLISAPGEYNTARAAVEAMAQIGGERAIAALEEAACHHDRRLRDAAVAALHQLRAQQAALTSETRKSSGKQLVGGQGVTLTAVSGKANDLLVAMQAAAGRMLARRITCAGCQATFCLECGNAVGHQRGTGKTQCRRCGRAAASSQL